MNVGFKTSLYLKLILAQVAAFFISQVLVTYVFAGAVPIVRPEFKRDLADSPRKAVVIARELPEKSGKFVTAFFEKYQITAQKKLPGPWVPAEPVPPPIDPIAPPAEPTAIISQSIEPTPIGSGGATPTPEQFRPPATPTPFPTSRPTATRTPIRPTTAVPTSSQPDLSTSQKEQQTLSLINQRRRAAGRRDLTVDSSLTTAARRHSNDLARNNCLPDGHTGSDGSTPPRRAWDAGWRGMFVGETVACLHSTPESVVDAWWASAGHKAILTAGSATKIGIAWVGSYQTAILGY